MPVVSWLFPWLSEEINMFRRIALLTTCLALVGLAGCGPNVKLNTVPAAGKVTYNGQAVEGATVTFFPVDPNSGKPALGTTDSAGNFTLETAVGGALKPAKGALV